MNKKFAHPSSETVRQESQSKAWLVHHHALKKIEADASDLSETRIMKFYQSESKLDGPSKGANIHIFFL